MNGLEAFNKLVATLNLKEKIAENKIHRSWQSCIEAIERELKVNQILKEKEVDLEYLCYTIRQQPFLNPSELLQLCNNRLIWGFTKRQLTLEEITLIVDWLKGE